MKKLLLVLVIAVLALSGLAVFTGCKDGSDEFKVGAIYITSQQDTAGYTFAHHQGIKAAIRNLGIPEENLLIQDNVSEDKTAVSNAIDILAGKGAKMIIGISFGYIEAFAEKAPEYPDIVFSHATGYLSNDVNFNNYFGRIYQARYLSGIAAGLKSLEISNNNIGYVAAWGIDYSETASGINAFALGAQAANPNAQVKVKVISTWGDEQKEKQAAEALIDTYGCGIIAQHCDSAQAQIVANTKGKFGVGYNSDMTDKAPNAHLTAAIWNWDVYYTAAIRAAKEGPADFLATIGKDWYGGLKEGFVDVSPLTKNVAAGTQSAIDQVKAMMIAWQDNNAAENGFDVFGGNKLSITVNNGVATVTKTEAALKKADGTEVVAAGGAYVGDGVIKGDMLYYIEGVAEV